MNSEYFVALAETFEKQYDVAFQGIRQGAVSDQRERLIQFKTNIDVVMSLLDRNGLGDWLADRLVAIAETLQDDLPLRINTQRDPFQDERLRVANLPVESQRVTVRHPVSDAEKHVDIALFRKPGDVAGTRRAISEILKWMNCVTDDRFITLAADLSGSINVEHGHIWGHYDQTPIRSAPGSKPPLRKPAMPPRPLGSLAECRARPATICRGVGLERYLWGLYPSHVLAGSCLE